MPMLIVYDLTRLNDTLPNAIKWKERVDSFICRGPGKSISMLLLGNKACYSYIASYNVPIIIAVSRFL